MSSFKLNDKLVKSAFKRSASRHYVLPDKEKEPEQGTSIFTEEDFAKFAAEYTGQEMLSGCPGNGNTV